MEMDLTKRRIINGAENDQNKDNKSNVLCISELKRSTNSSSLKVSNLEGDYKNVALLLFLYFLQGIPMGLAKSIPLFLQSKGASFSDQAIFQFVPWPYSMKLFWAPIVDSVYNKKFGRRKSWIAPVQVLAGTIMLIIGHTLGTFMDDDANDKPIPIKLFSLTFFVLYFLVATQDIAVDGWALTLLREENKGYAATCNAIGQTAGIMTSYALFLALNSADFCNKYLREIPNDTAMVSFEDFMKFWGYVLILSTIVLVLIQTENPNSKIQSSSNQLAEKDTPSMITSYKQMWIVASGSKFYHFICYFSYKRDRCDGYGCSSRSAISQVRYA